MNAKWSLVTGIATLLALLLSVLFFVATQSITGRDWIVLVIGTLVGAGGAAFIATFIFHSDSRTAKKNAAAAEALAATEAKKQREQKETELMRLIPNRRDHLEALHEQKLELEVEISNSQGYEAIGVVQAQDAARHGFTDIALENQTAAKSWKLNYQARTAQLARIEEEIARVEALSDAEWKAEQAQHRLVTSEDFPSAS
ncbi:hypothetical protein FB468_2824 [Leucobacter komagatae]|uniref:Uncharacterized protein n=1 Tax=Leucobacter komagatae TaxID=55969 RepID=A0A542Y9J6_9MICO|nr:hypothetical protein [Leucobacter komagatae]TQL44756.1 hypothetical protein FB468_2824 [Leucobacter komagatae]